MLTATPYIVKMFEYIAYDVQQKTGIQVHYEHGHPFEIDNILQSWEKTPANSAVKYPLIALFQDFEETRGTATGTMAEVKLELIIATMTKPEYNASQRMCYSFIPILYPIYDQFIKSVYKSGYFFETNKEQIQHTKTDRMFWGKNKAAAFGDYVDAIQITNLQLKVKTFKCS